MHITFPVDVTSELAIQTTRDLLHDPSFCPRHRVRPQDFTRRRSLTFMNVVGLLLQKTVRSIQLHLHDFFGALDPKAPSVGASAWSEARLKLRHTAFIELNEKAVLEVLYGPASTATLRRWHGHRVLAIDSSLVRLPTHQKLGQAFGWVECANQQGEVGRYPQARLSVFTDVLNRIAVHTLLVPWQQGERGLALEHLAHHQEQDLTLMDRGFAAYELFAQFIAQQRRFVCRCAASGFSIVNQLLAENQAERSVVVSLRPSTDKLALIRHAHLPEEIRVRFVTLRLATGELEVLATNLLDEARYPTSEFKELYGERWGIETYYGLLKGRLDLQNFSGLSEEAVRQDVYAAVFLSNLESILIGPAQAALREKSPNHQPRQQVNHAVSFHALKARTMDLLLSQEPLDQVLPRLQELFLANPVSVRPERVVPRRKTSAWRSYHYQRHVKKSVF
jgi:hypothetical protein